MDGKPEMKFINREAFVSARGISLLDALKATMLHLNVDLNYFCSRFT